MKILIANDGSKNADEALKSLRKAGLAELEIEALVVSVEETWMPAPPPSSYEMVGLASAAQVSADVSLQSDETEKGASCRTAKKAALWLRETFPKWKVRAESLYGVAAQEVIKRAEEWKPDLIVVGALGRSAVGRFVLGSVSQKILRHGCCPVRIGRATAHQERASERVLIGYDGSSRADKAVRAVSERKWSPHSKAKLVFAEEMPIVEDGNFAEVQRKLQEAANLLISKGLSVSTNVLFGEPKEILLTEAETWEADCIFLGARGLNLVERFLLGSVSSSVTAEARCSVEIVR